MRGRSHGGEGERGSVLSLLGGGRGQVPQGEESGCVCGGGGGTVISCFSKITFRNHNS